MSSFAPAKAGPTQLLGRRSTTMTPQATTTPRSLVAARRCRRHPEASNCTHSAPPRSEPCCAVISAGSRRRDRWNDPLWALFGLQAMSDFSPYRSGADEVCSNKIIFSFPDSKRPESNPAKRGRSKSKLVFNCLSGRGRALSICRPSEELGTAAADTTISRPDSTEQLHAHPFASEAIPDRRDPSGTGRMQCCHGAG
jgi:hypothetical protein